MLVGQLLPKLVFAVLVLATGVLKLPDLVKYFEGLQLFFKVLLIEFLEVFEAKNLVVFQFPLQKSPDLLHRQLSVLEHFSSFLGRSIKLVFFVFDDLDSGFEEPVFLSSPDDLLSELRPLFLFRLVLLGDGNLNQVLVLEV